MQGDGIEYTDPRNYEYSGSGDSDASDDTETGGDDDSDDDLSKINIENKQNVTVENNETLRKDSKFWKETSKLIMKGKGKNDRNVQTGVYFDDQKHNELKKAWSDLLRRYQEWYDSSKYSKKLR